jgi:RimJ/RimL family protein N-acetyltransferase
MTLPLRSARLTIRPFIEDDLMPIHALLDRAFNGGALVEDAAALAERRSWLQWSILSQRWFPALHQPAYGERAVVLTTTGELVAAVGLVPLVDVYDQIPELRWSGAALPGATAEVGLFWATDPAHQGRGYATEAARELIDHAFETLRLARILATTEHDNQASQAVMRKLGMRITRNPLPDPHWLQVVGVLNRPTKDE